MDPVLTYRGRLVTAADVAFIERLIAEHPTASRRALSQKLCAAWGWVQPNGALRDMVARGLLLALHRAGRIALPGPRMGGGGRGKRQVQAPIEVDTTPFEMALSELGPVEIRQVRRSADEPVVSSLIAHYHYQGYVRPVGEHLSYLVCARGRPIGCFMWSSPPLQLLVRDQYIGWSREARREHLHLLAYQTRFLIVPWVRVPHLASHLLGRMSRQLSADWERVYAHPIVFVTTFVDPERFWGTCYRAANWTCLGKTAGRGHYAPTRAQTRSRKLVFGYALVRNFRRRLGVTR